MKRESDIRSEGHIGTHTDDDLCKIPAGKTPELRLLRIRIQAVGIDGVDSERYSEQKRVSPGIRQDEIVSPGSRCEEYADRCVDDDLRKFLMNGTSELR